ncbi:unnamed protein product, partial [Brassica napus]
VCKINSAFSFLWSSFLNVYFLFVCEFPDAFRTIMKEEELIALYKGIVPGLALVSHGAIQFTVYEELHKVIVDSIGKIRKLMQDFSRV